MSRRARIRSQHVRRTPHVVLNAWQIAINGACKLSDKDVAGHIALKVFAGFVAMLGFSLGALGWVGGVLPLALTVALYALELLVAFLQAYVFTWMIP